MPHALAPVASRQAPVSPRPRHISYALVRRRAHTLGMPDALLECCRTVSEMQALLRPLYHARAAVTHPDHLSGRKTWRAGQPVRGESFQRLSKAYTWLMGLNPQARLQRLPALPVPIWERDYPDVGVGYHILYG